MLTGFLSVVLSIIILKVVDMVRFCWAMTPKHSIWVDRVVMYTTQRVFILHGKSIPKFSYAHMALLFRYGREIRSQLLLQMLSKAQELDYDPTRDLVIDHLTEVKND